MGSDLRNDSPLICVSSLILLPFQTQTPTFLEKLLNRVLSPIRWLIASKFHTRILFTIFILVIK